MTRGPVGVADMAHNKVDYAWGEKAGFVMNRTPLKGRFGDNVFYSPGYSGNAVNLVHVCGEMPADEAARRYCGLYDIL